METPMTNERWLIAALACAVLSSTGCTRDKAEASSTKQDAVKPAVKEQYFPLQSYRSGPYAAGGTGFFGGFIDYMQLINARDQGVNGVKFTWSECETEYFVGSGVVCD